MKAQKHVLALVVLVGLLLAACVPASPQPSVDGTAWILATLGGQALTANTTVTLSFENGKASGSDGCNRYGASFTVTGDKLTFGKDMMSTMMACPEPVMKQATAFTKALQSTATYKSDGKQLTLLDGSGKTLATFTAQSTTLGGTTWNVTGINNGKQAVVSVLAGSKLTAEFGTDGKLTGSAGCNNYNTTYGTTGKTIKIGPAATTRKLCADPAGVMEQEAQFVKALQDATVYSMEGNKLELRNASGALMVSLEKGQ